MSRRILVNASDMACYTEAVAAAAVSPGMIVENHTLTDCRANTVLDGSEPLSVAVENDIFGRGPADLYSAGEIVIQYDLQPGDEVLLAVAAGAAAVAYGDILNKVADGTVIGGAFGAASVAKATEVLDNSGSADIGLVKAKIL